MTVNEIQEIQDYDLDTLVCVFCDMEINADYPYCTNCNEYKGIMTISAWQEYTGEEWV